MPLKKPTKSPAGGRPRTPRGGLEGAQLPLRISKEERANADARAAAAGMTANQLAYEACKRAGLFRPLKGS